ncbi:interferon-induced very large GTPase 1-like [Ruditapes philippinarum]|uniref:interferon-induced very large GTPase 1-like n=1 Tax=Ruditapes philippinarum TaxID=129788 RepID=UPI00295B4249|nr:interferon-induced very large GTPase 1-like [Ruditapes philippinarum]
MGIDIETYRGRIGTFRFSSGVDVVTIVCPVNLSGGIKVIGTVLFIGLLLLLSGIEPNPGPKENDDEQARRTIKVAGIPAGIDKQYLTLFFKSSRKCGGGKISNIQFDEENHSAVIQFENVDTVQSVLQRRPIKIAGAVLDIDSFGSEPSFNFSICSSPTIEVTGFQTGDSQMTEFLELYFEDEESSGGDTIANITVDDDGKALVTFESIEVAQRVVNKSTHTLKQNTLKVVPHRQDIPPEHDIDTYSSTPSMEITSAQASIPETIHKRTERKVDMDDILVEVPERCKLSNIVEKRFPTDNEIKDKAKANSDKILHLTGLTDKFPEKITIAEIMSIDLKADVKHNYANEELPWILLRRILGVQSKARDRSGIINDHTERAEQTHARDVETIVQFFDHFTVDDTNDEGDGTSPLDIFLITLQCCDPMLKQLLFQKLYLCKIAFPFIQYDKSLNDWEFIIWPLRSLVVESYNISQTPETETREFEILELPVKTVTFANFGRPDYSKSKLMNDLLSDDIQDTFFNINCPLGMSPKSCSKGTVEMFTLPICGLKEKKFEDAIAFFNLRGRIEENFTTEVITFVSKISDILVLLLDESSIIKRDEELCKMITNFTTVIIVIASKTKKSTVEQFIEKLTPTTRPTVRIISTYKARTQKNSKDFSEQLRQLIATRLKISAVKSLDDRVNECSSHLSDETRTDCAKAKVIATQVFQSMTDIGSKGQMKRFITPVHFIYSKQIGTSIRSLHRMKNVQETHTITAKIKQIRKIQLQSISRSMKLFLQSLDNVKDKPMMVQYLVKWLSILLDRQKRKQIPSLVRQNQLHRQELVALQSNTSSKDQDINTLKEEIAKSQESIEDANLGIEHMFRELGHIYESVIVMKADPTMYQLPSVQNVIHIMTSLIVSGQIFEIIDGDNFFLPSEWVQAVLEQVSKNIHSKKCLTLSVLGVQSSGKSTLLNSLFGSLFPVKSGRCTRGIHMQIMPITPNNSLPFSYVTVIDSEGLRSTERTSTTHNHDNELSTVIAGLGDITLLNVMGENTNEIRDIVQVVVHAFLKLKLANKQLDIGKIFFLVHQNVIDTTARENLRTGLNALIETLDCAAKNAGEIEGIREIKAFHQVIDFDTNANVWYLPSYWQGNPPMARVNATYSDRVFDKKGTLLQKALECKDKSYKSLGDAAIHIRDLWKGVLTEDFVFSFRNSLEIKVYIHMEETLKDILIKFEDKIENKHVILSQKYFSECSNQQHLPDTSDRLVKQMRTILAENLSLAVEEVNEYFDNSEYKDILVQWQDFAKKRTEALYLELEDRIRTETLRLRDRTRIELKIKEDSLGHEAKMYERSLQVAKYIKGECLNMEEIENKFEQTWHSISREILDFGELEDVSKSLADNFERCLFDILSTEQLILKTEFEKRRNNSFYIINTLTGSFDLSGIVLDDISFSSESFRQDNEIKMSRVKDEINKTLCEIETLVGTFLGDMNELTYREVKHILYKIYKKIQLLQNQENDISLKITGVIKLCIHVTAFCSTRFDAHNAEYHKSRGIHARISNYKVQVREQFIAYVKDRKAEETAAKQITVIVENILLDKIQDRIQYTVKVILKQTLPQLKYHLIIEVLEDLTVADDFDSFIKYIKTPRNLVKDWVKKKAKTFLFNSNMTNFSKIVNKVVNEFYNDIQVSIDKCYETFRHESPTSEEWTKSFVQNFSMCPIGTSEFKNVTKWFSQIENIKNFSSLLTDSIKASSEEIVKQLITKEQVERIIKFKGPESMVKALFQQVWGCPEQCPFCGEPCAKAFIHGGTNHFSLQHRISSCLGAREDFIHKAVLSSCNFNVQSDLEHHCDLFGFRCNKEAKKRCGKQWHLFRNYREHIPDWDIEPNANIQECSKFWLWFVAKYKYQLAIYYKYDISDIPDSWDEITQAEALENLRRIYSL